MTNSQSRQLWQHGVGLICVLLALVISAGAFCAVPTSDEPGTDRLDHMLTPRARIHLGIGQANTERLTRRSVSGSLSTTLPTHWRGIVEYLFPSDGLVRKGDPIARIYDPEILSDLARARSLMSIFDVSPLTIAAARRSSLLEAEPVVAPEPPAPTIARAPATPAASAAIDVPDFDFEANAARQGELRSQAELTARMLTDAVSARDAANAEVEDATRDIAERERLFEDGALAEGALAAPSDRLNAARATASAAETQLEELQAGYGRIARQIRELEGAAEQAHMEIDAARATARIARQPAPEPVEAPPLQETPAENRAPVPPGTGARMPREVRDLAAPRYQEITAPGHAMISDVISPEGTLVDVDEELLRLSNIQLARLTARVSHDALPQFRQGRAVTLSFEDYPSVAFEGWVASADGVPGADEADVNLLVVCEPGAGINDAYLALQWMVLEAGVDATSDPQSLSPVTEPAPVSPATRLLRRIFPLLGPEEQFVEMASGPEVARKDLYEGRLRLQPMPRISDDDTAEPAVDDRLAALDEWRRSYLDGMVTTVLSDGSAITFPAEGEVSTAVRRMLTGRVSHGRNLCARTMREALGWGLGDAHSWAYRLPHRGYVPRADGGVRPGDILVWPFSYGPGRSEHIGIAVRQGRKLVLLSNLSGCLGTSEIPGGYIAFHQPEAEKRAAVQSSDAGADS